MNCYVLLCMFVQIKIFESETFSLSQSGAAFFPTFLFFFPMDVFIVSFHCHPVAEITNLYYVFFVDLSTFYIIWSFFIIFFSFLNIYVSFFCLRSCSLE